MPDTVILEHVSHVILKRILDYAVTETEAEAATEAMADTEAEDAHPPDGGFVLEEEEEDGNSD
jgi:hypothetical protein